MADDETEAKDERCAKCGEARVYFLHDNMGMAQYHPFVEPQPARSEASLTTAVASMRRCKCEPSSGCPDAAVEAEIVRDIAAAEAERDALRAENERLRALVAKMHDAAMDAPCSFDKPKGRFCTIDNPICALHLAHDAARAALAKGKN